MTTVRTESGLLHGGHDHRAVASFLGVPFAEAPTGARRFAAPEPVRPWPGVRTADRLGPVCPQVATYGPVGTAATSEREQGENFLTLNVRTPDVNGSAPVLVWVHGGGYAVGSGAEPVLQSGAFARSGIVEVTVNYRLGALGFLWLGEHAPANRGLLDQIAALRWVQENIAFFGGDPSNVTLAGRSAGGFSVATLMAMPSAKGLFRRALVQSGASPAVITVETAENITSLFCHQLGVKAHEIPQIPTDKLLSVQKALCDDAYTRHRPEVYGDVAVLGLPFQPVIDGVTLPEHPERAVAGGFAADIDLMIGTTTGEAVTHTSIHPEMTDAEAARLVHPRVVPLGLTGHDIVSAYRKLLPDHTGKGLLTAITGDLVFQLPTSRFAAAQSDHARVFKYLYGEHEPNGGGARHGAEVGYVWRNPDGPAPDVPERFVPTDPELADSVHATWAAFVSSGSPETPHMPHWPLHSPGEPTLVRIDGTGFHLESDIYWQRLAAWGQGGA
ncbi:carboxylesterase family protein [Nonomuraea sp. NPDC046802]|uniref:carboxylesterase/lipase family protein n=1 Tax=Nonomuraea sp. NPDC046802 TaxID=3154919 RepID=UPI0033CF44B0